MEGKRRTYPARASRVNWVKSILLAATAVVVLSGVVFRGDDGRFAVERLSNKEDISLDEAFDESMTESVIQLPASDWYALQMGVFESEASAKQASDVYQKRGAAGYLWLDGRWRVLAAAYPDKDSAQLVRSQLRDDHNIDSYLYEISFPAVSMRLTGMKGQLEILEAAFEHASELAKELQEISVALDRQEISCTEVCSRLAASGQQLRIVALRLGQRFEKPFHPTVGALMEVFESFVEFADEITPQESAVSMGVKLKYQTFVTLEGIQNVYQTLQNT